MGTAEPVFLEASELGITQALGVRPGEVVALVGAGGKTTAMFRAAAELAAVGGRVLVTTTTRILPPTPEQAPITVVDDNLQRLIPTLQTAFSVHPIVVLARSVNPEGKLQGIDPQWLSALRGLPGLTNVLVEADGSAERAFKAPATYEPVIPPDADLVVPVAGLSVVGQPLSSVWVHRPERVMALARVAEGDPVTPELIAAVLLHPEGGARGVPAQARLVLLLNQADDVARLTAGRLAAREAVRRGALRVVIAAVRGPHPVREVVVPGPEGRATDSPVCAPVCPTGVSAIILAAGEARRMGQPKLRMQLGGKGLLRRVVEVALAAPVDEVVVVLGHAAAELERELPPDPRLLPVHNPHYAAGQSTSLRAGIAALRPTAEAAVFLLGDQPLVAPTVLAALVTTFRAEHPPVVQPLYRDGPGHPVLFARRLFPELLQTSGDRGGRDVLARHRNEGTFIAVGELGPADIDTLADYERLASLFPER